MKDYDELLEHCHNEILKFQVSNSCTKVETKNHLENLRSILEYIAQEINQTLSRPTAKTYFPYADDTTKFTNSVNKSLINLKNEKPEIHDLIENLQSYKLGDSWLTDLCNLTNEAKHRNLIETKEVESKGVRIPGFINSTNSRIFIRNLILNGKSIKNFEIVDDKLSYDNQDQIQLDFEVINEKIIKFANAELNVIDFLRKCTENITVFVNDYRELHEKYCS